MRVNTYAENPGGEKGIISLIIILSLMYLLRTLNTVYPREIAVFFSMQCLMNLSLNWNTQSQV